MYISDACNLRCRHCWISPLYSPSRDKGHFLKVEYIKKAIREARSLGLRTVKLSGGEPFLHPDIRKILSLISDQGFGINIETNGTKIGPEMAGFLREIETFCCISVSVDGLDAKTHDWFRGVSGCFDQAVAGIKNLVAANIRPQLICTLHQRNAYQTEKMIDMAASLGCSSIKFNHIQPMGRGKTDPDGLRLAPEQILDLYAMVEKRMDKNNGIRVFFDVPYAFKSLRKLVYDPLGRCHVKNILGILADGRVSICGVGEAVPELIFGHVAEDSLRDIWLTHPVLQEIREIIPKKMEGVCSECIHRNFCLGNCIAQNFFITKKLTSPFWFCQYARENNQFPENRLK
jgi:SynChlorMet cassette radical SAM/SPASM protein ScmF